VDHCHQRYPERLSSCQKHGGGDEVRRPTPPHQQLGEVSSPRGGEQSNIKRVNGNFSRNLGSVDSQNSQDGRHRRGPRRAASSPNLSVLCIFCGKKGPGPTRVWEAFQAFQGGCYRQGQAHVPPGPSTTGKSN